MQTFETHTVQAYTLGHGDPLLLISGLSGLGSIWEPVMLKMHGQQTITFDHPGVATSSTTSEQTIDGIVQAALEVLDVLGVQCADILGHSTGTLVAQALALDHPQRVHRVVLSSGWAAPDRRFRDLFSLRKTVLTSLGFSSYRTLGDVLGHPTVYYEQLPPPARCLPQEQIHQQSQVITDRIDMLLGYNRASELANISHPTLVLGARDDAIVPFHHAEELAAAIPHAALRELSGGHFTQVVRPDEYAAIITEFLTA